MGAYCCGQREGPRTLDEEVQEKVEIAFGAYAAESGDKMNVQEARDFFFANHLDDGYLFQTWFQNLDADGDGHITKMDLQIFFGAQLTRLKRPEVKAPVFDNIYENKPYDMRNQDSPNTDCMVTFASPKNKPRIILDSRQVSVSPTQATPQSVNSGALHENNEQTPTFNQTPASWIRQQTPEQASQNELLLTAQQQYEADLESLKGKLPFQDGRDYEGSFDGFGKLTWPSGDYYQGQLKDGKRHGRGVYQYKDQHKFIKYDGNWVNDKRHGYGTLVYADGREYQGPWKAGKQEGIGTQIDKDGVKKQGEWRNGKRTHFLDEPVKDEGKQQQQKARSSKEFLETYFFT